ncbi:IS200/IS605 family transposon protein TnpB [Halobellus sp. Atlit-31R]|nr:IS200/IS605 family transposon protein TnpB [Halobellus sp. Atlit-31R]
MKRVNTFEVVPQIANDKECLLRLLDASASLWNELTYERRQNYFGDGDVWDTSEYRGRYNGVVGSATVQQVTRKNSEAWRSFFALKEKGEYANPPSYWGNEEDGRELRTYIRNNQYTIQWGKRSRLDIPIGEELKDEYGLGYHERLRLEVRGNPKWDGKQGRLELEYDEGVATVYVGDLTDVLKTHWSVRVNEKTHNFWAFKKFIHRLACVCEEYGISLEAESEAWTSQTCPECGDHEETVRHGDTLTCPCGFEGHADLTASETFLRKTSDCEIRPMARPVRFEWDDHDWSGKPHPHESPKEVRTNPQVASVGR